MDSATADVDRWDRGQKLAGQRIALEARRETMDLAEALDRVDDLRDLAELLGASTDPGHSEQENLAFHLTWARVRRAFGLG